MRLSLPATLLLALISPASADWSTAAMNRHIDQTNFMVNDGCSGTLVDLKARYILTANHCVQDQYEVIEREKVGDDGVITKERVRRAKAGTVKQLYFNGASETHEITYRTKLIATDSDKDLALLKIVSESIPNTIAAKIACVAPQRGDTIYVVGNPMGILYSSVVKGIVSSTQRDYGMIGLDPDNEGLTQISSGVIGGNSGGAAYNADGYLVGVPVRASRVNEILGFAVTLESVTAFLKKNATSDLFEHCASI